MIINLLNQYSRSLPIKSRITYKIACLTHTALYDHQPSSLANLLRPYNPSRSLRSSYQHLLTVPPHSLSHFWQIIWCSCSNNLELSASLSLHHISSFYFPELAKNLPVWISLIIMLLKVVSLPLSNKRLRFSLRPLASYYIYWLIG